MTESSSALDADDRPDPSTPRQIESGDVGGRAVISHYWPTEGPHTPERIAAAGAAIEELMRYLNYATREQLDAPTLSGLIGDLADAENRRDQLYKQMHRNVLRLRDDDTAFLADMAPSSATLQGEIGRAADALDRAISTAETHRLTLGTARSALTFIGHRADEDRDARARAMYADGATHRQIMAELGYRSLVETRLAIRGDE